MRAAGVAAAAVLLTIAGEPPQQPGLPQGVVRAGEYRLNTAGAGPPATAGSVYDVGPFPLSPPDLPPGEGRDATVAMCSVCHSLRYITTQPPLPPETWQATVRKMIDVHGAAIPADAAARITAYLQAHFSAGGR